MFRYNLFPSRRGPGSFGVPPARSASTAAPRQSGGHNWGRGRVLGAEVD